MASQMGGKVRGLAGRMVGYSPEPETDTAARPDQCRNPGAKGILLAERSVVAGFGLARLSDNRWHSIRSRDQHRDVVD
jgi:hypothetical protein